MTTDREAKRNDKRSLSASVEEILTDRQRDLPVWVRAPKRGYEFYSGCSRAKLYEWAGKGFIRSVSIREPGKIKGVRLFHLASTLEFIERCETGAKSISNTNASSPNCE